MTIVHVGNIQLPKCKTCDCMSIKQQLNRQARGVGINFLWEGFKVGIMR